MLKTNIETKQNTSKTKKKINLIVEHDFHDMYRLRVGVVCPTWTNIKVWRKWPPKLVV